MKHSFPRVIVFCITTILSTFSLAGEKMWSKANEEIEAVALKDPGPGFAIWHLCNIALETENFAELHERWEARQKDPNAALLLGWLDFETGKIKEARAVFARVVEMSPKSSRAWRSLGEAQLRLDEKGSDESLRRAADLSDDEGVKAESLLRTARFAQERGDLAGAWKILAKLEAEPLRADVRILLAPEFARAHLALGDSLEWAEKLAKAKDVSSDNAAVYAAACIALGDSGLAHSVASESLKRDPKHRGLQVIALRAAHRAGFLREAADRSETEIGNDPSDESLITTLQNYAELGAPEHALRVFARYSQRLAPIASRWRPLLPTFWKHEITPEIQKAFAPHQQAGGWELQFALGEIAILEHDFDAARAALWRVFAKEFDDSNLASTIRATKNGVGEYSLIPMPGQSLERRYDELKVQVDGHPEVFYPDDKVKNRCSVTSLTGARDIAAVYLQLIAIKSGGKAPAEFISKMREQTAHWLPEERLLVFVTAVNPESALDAIDAILAGPPPPLHLEEFIRKCLIRIGAIPELRSDLVAHLSTVVEKLPKQEASPRRSAQAVSGWMPYLRECWVEFDQAHFAEADKAFETALSVLGGKVAGPSTEGWVSFHTAILFTVAAFEDPKIRADAAALALRWLGMQTPRRHNWPAAPCPQVLWETLDAPLGLYRWPMFQSTRRTRLFAYGSMGKVFFNNLGGSIPDDLLNPIFFLSIKLRDVDPALFDERFKARTKDLSPESARVALLAKTVTEVFRSSTQLSPEVIESLKASPDASVVNILLGKTILSSQSRGADGSPEQNKTFAKGMPFSPVARATWLAALLHIESIRPTTDNHFPIIEELTTLPFDTAAYNTAKQALSTLSKHYARDGGDKAANLTAASGKLTLAWQKRNNAPPLPSEIKERLITLTYAAEVEAATALARSVLAWPSRRFDRSKEALATAQQAVSTLLTCGEFTSWITDIHKTAKPDNAEAWKKIALVTGMVPSAIQESEASAPDDDAGRRGKRGKPSLDAHIRRNVEALQREACYVLIRLEPENEKHWEVFQQINTRRSEDSAQQETKPDVSIETLAQAGKGGMYFHRAVGVIRNDTERLAGLLEKWPITEKTAEDTASIEAARTLWRAGKQEQAIAWLKKIAAVKTTSYSRGNLRPLLIEMLAARNDITGITDYLADEIREALNPGDAIGTFARDNSWGFVTPTPYPLHPLLEDAKALGVSAAIRTKFENSDAYLSKELAMLLGVHARDAKLLSTLPVRMEQPMPPHLCEEFAELLADWPEAREGAQTALRKLEPIHALKTPSERMLQYSRHGLLAARCGMKKEAERWLFEVLAVHETVQGNQPEILLNLHEGLLLNPILGDIRNTTMKRLTTMKLAACMKNREYSSGQNPVEIRIRELIAKGDEKTARSIASAIAANGTPKDRSLAATLQELDMNLAALNGKAESLTPIARQVGNTDDGQTEIYWSHGWQRTLPQQTPVWCTPSIKGGQRLRIELFFGPNQTRLERIAVMDDAGISGTWRGKLPESSGWIALCTTANYRAVFGPPIEITRGKNILPDMDEILKKIPPILWKKGEGPGGDALESIRFSKQNSHSSPSPAEAIIALHNLAGNDITITGWRKHGGVHLSLHDENGAWQNIGGTQSNAGEDWEWFETKIPAQHLLQRSLKKLDKAPEYALILQRGGCYSALKVVATPSKHPSETRPEE